MLYRREDILYICEKFNEYVLNPFYYYSFSLYGGYNYDYHLKSLLHQVYITLRDGSLTERSMPCRPFNGLKVIKGTYVCYAFSQ